MNERNLWVKSHRLYDENEKLKGEEGIALDATGVIALIFLSLLLVHMHLQEYLSFIDVLKMHRKIINLKNYLIILSIATMYICVEKKNSLKVYQYLYIWTNIQNWTY